jgi:D-cysteine desulfhydrase
MSPPPRLSLARTPTPLEKLERWSAQVGTEVWVKRDDLTGLELTGNKSRKLEFLVAEAEALGADTLITCGGINSNHARATAMAAVKRGLGAHLVLRGVDRVPPVGNLLLDRFVGAGVELIDQRVWEDRVRYLPAVADRLRALGKKPYVIPEGGSNALGSMGYALAVEEIFAQTDALGLLPKAIVHACGSGGTTAGLALGVAQIERDVEVLAVAVCNDAAYFEARINGIIEDAMAAGYVDRATATRAKFTILEGHQGPGYALTTPEAMAEHARLARCEGLLVDPVYTGKAMLGLVAEARAGRFAEGPVVFLHTGGVFELFAYGHEIAALR